MPDSLGFAGPTEADKVAFLSRPDVWPHSPRTVKVVETHMSWVFLAGERVYKLKKPVRTPFLDFSTLAKREEAVAEELRLNRRLAPGVYLGLKPLLIASDCTLSLGSEGEVVDWMVEMRRLPEECTLKSLIDAGTLKAEDLEPMAALLARFYRSLGPAETTPEDYAARFWDEYCQTKRVLTDPAIGFERTAPAKTLARFETDYGVIRPLLEGRVRAGKVVEGHGDLRPEHVFLTNPPVIIDCLEFNRGLRAVDPFDEVAFLGLESARLGADWIGTWLYVRIEEALGDRPDAALVAFYWRYRALLRARLALLHLKEPKPRHPERWRPLAREYLRLANEAEIRILGR